LTLIAYFVMRIARNNQRIGWDVSHHFHNFGQDSPDEQAFNIESFDWAQDKHRTRNTECRHEEENGVNQ